MKKFLCIFLVVVIGVLSVVVIGFRSVGLSTGTKIIKLDYLMKSYDKEPNDETLAKIMVTSFSILAYTPLQEYGDIFFLSEDADAKYEAFVPEITKFIEKYDYPFNTPEECYDFMLVHYLTSYMYDLKTLEHKTNVEEFVDRFDKCIPRWNDFEPEMFIFYACEIVDDGDVLKQRLLYALDLYALTADKETAQNIYFTLSKIYHEIGNKDLYDYYLLLTAIKNDETFTYELGSGIIEDWDIQTLKKMVETSTKEDFPSIKQLEALYKVAPRSNNQVDFPIFIFESTDYYVVYYNNPACAASILDKNTGEIVFFINRVLEYNQSRRTGDGFVIES